MSNPGAGERKDAVREPVEITTLEERVTLAVSIAYHEGYRAGLADRVGFFFRGSFDAEDAKTRICGLLQAIRVASIGTLTDAQQPTKRTT